VVRDLLLLLLVACGHCLSGCGCVRLLLLLL
jgi:hypothetical protein